MIICCAAVCGARETNYEGVGLSMRTFAALRMRPGGSTVSVGIFVCFFIALKILTCYYQCREQRPWGRTGVRPAGKGRVLARGGASSS